MKLVIILLLFVNGSISYAQKIHPDSLYILVLSSSYRDSTEKQIQLCSKKEKDSLFKKVRNALTNEELDENLVNYVICYFEYHASKENIDFLFANNFTSTALFMSLTSCSCLDVLGTYGKAVRKIAKQKVIDAKSYREFYQMNLLVFGTQNLSIKQKEKYFNKLRKNYPHLEDYVVRTLNGEI